MKKRFLVRWARFAAVSEDIELPDGFSTWTKDAQLDWLNTNLESPEHDYFCDPEVESIEDYEFED